MGDPVTLGLIGAGTGLLKNELVDAPREARQKKYNAAVIRYSPWTGMKPGQTQYSDPFGNMLQFGTTGAMMGLMNPGSGAAAAPAVDNFTGAGPEVGSAGAPSLGVNTDLGFNAAPAMNDLSGGPMAANNASLSWEGLARQARSKMANGIPNNMNLTDYNIG